MGFSISWLAVRGADTDTVLGVLDLTQTGERDGFPTESPIAGAALEDGWYVVVLDRYGHAFVDDDTLRRVSELGDVVAGAAEEHVMCSFACGWERGQRIWWAMHDAQIGIGHLQTDGAMPPDFEAIRRELLDEQHAAGGDDAEVDYVFDIPLRLATVASGFSYTETEPEDGFVVLRPLGDAKRRRWRR